MNDLPEKGFNDFCFLYISLEIFNRVATKSSVSVKQIYLSVYEKISHVFYCYFTLNISYLPRNKS